MCAFVHVEEIERTTRSITSTCCFMRAVLLPLLQFLFKVKKEKKSFVCIRRFVFSSSLLPLHSLRFPVIRALCVCVIEVLSACVLVKEKKREHSLAPGYLKNDTN